MKTKKKNNYNIIFYIYFGFLTVIAVGCCLYFASDNNEKKDNNLLNNTQVNNDSNELINKIIFSKKSYSVNIGEYLKIIPTIFPEDAYNQELEWSSSNKNVASVDKNGNVLALNKGVSLISAKSSNGVSGSYYVMVYQSTSEVFVPVYSLNIDRSEVTLELNDSLKLSATITPSNATNKNVIWLSSNSKVVSVNQNGKIKAIGYGSSTVTVLSDSGKKDSVKVIVNNKASILEIPSYVPNTSNPSTVNVVASNELLSKLNLNNISMAQVVVFSNGIVNNSISYGTNDNASFPISSASKSILGIIASKMHEENIINLDTSIDKYWHQVNSYDFNSCTNEWKKSIGSEDTLRKYTKSSVDLVENKASIRNCLTHSSTVKNMSMVHLRPNDNSSEYFGGGMSKNYGVAAFMLSHTYHQLFEKNGIPGKTTSYNYLSDDLTREHSLAGFTMQIAMKETINEYLNKSICSKIGCTSSPKFLSGNSIYFATNYTSSALDVAKIISAISNEGIYNNFRIFNKNTVDNIEKIESNLKNQTIAFDYIDGKYVKYGIYSKINGSSNYKLNDVLNNYATYISYDPVRNIGFVCNIKYNSKENKNNAYNDFNNLSNYFY